MRKSAVGLSRAPLLLGMALEFGCGTRDEAATVEPVGERPSNSSIENDPEFGRGAACGPIPGALITDFSEPSDADASSVTFGDFGTTLYGLTFQYPGPDEPYPITSDVSGGSWRLTGSVGSYSGFGVTFVPPVDGVSDCTLDASAYTGLSFTIRGTVGGAGAVTMNLPIASNEVSHVWINQVTNAGVLPNSSRCIPAGNEPSDQYDGSCLAPWRAIPVTEALTQVSVLWGDFGGGSPSESVNPTEILYFAWYLPVPAGADTDNPTPYDLDITIDDLMFTQ